jgi:hypothetical protein
MGAPQLWRGGGGQFGRGAGVVEDTKCYFVFHSLNSGSFLFFSLSEPSFPPGAARGHPPGVVDIGDQGAGIDRFSDSDCGERFINDLRMTLGYCGDNRGSGLWF